MHLVDSIEPRVLNARSGHGHGWLIVPPLVLLPFFLGGARPWIWSGVAAFFLVCAAISCRLEQRPSSGARAWYRSGWCILLGGIVAYPLFQAIPLPLSLLASMSPLRAAWLQRGAETAHSSGLAGLSYVPLVTGFSWLRWIFLACYAVVLRRFLLERKALGGLFLALFLFSGFEALYGLLQALIPTLGALWVTEGSGVARGTFVNRNHFAAFLGMVWPLLLAYCLTLTSHPADRDATSFRETARNRENRQKQLFLAFIIGLVLLAIFFSMSRGGILGTLVALTVFVTLGGTRRKETVALVVLSWMVMVGYGCILGFDEILVRFDLMEHDAPGRFMLWKEAWRIIQDHPLTGTGLGSFPAVNTLYQAHLPDTLMAGHAHNDYLETIADLGVPVGAGMILMVWGYWWKTAWRVWYEEKEQPTGKRCAERRILAVGALAGSAAFLCHCWVDFNWQIPANQLYFVMLLVFMHGAGGKEYDGLNEASRHLDLVTHCRRLLPPSPRNL